MSRHSGANRCAFTLAEVLMSMAVAAVVLSAAAALAFAVGKAWSTSEDINEVVSSGRLGTVRVTDRIRSARAVGYTSAEVLLIWREDSNGDGLINLGELTVFEHDGDDRVLREGQLLFPGTLSQSAIDANNWEVSTGDFTRMWVFNQLRQNEYFRQGVVSEHVDEMVWIIDADVPDTRMVQLRMTLSKDGLSQTIHGGTALRMPIELE